MDMVPDYLNIIIAIVIFGIGFPSLILQYPSWLRRIRPRYSIFHGSYFLILVIIAFIFIALLEYEFYPPSLSNFCTSQLCNLISLIVIFVLFFASSVLSFLLSVYLYNNLNKKKSSLIGKSATAIAILITSLFFVFFVGVQWWILGQLLYYYAWMILGDISIPFTELKLISLRERYNDTSNVLVFIAIVGTIILWIRFYYHQFPMVLKRITNVGLCSMRANGLCLHYYILKQIKWLLSTEEEIGTIQVIKDLGAMGANAESEGDVISVLKSMQQIANAINKRHLDIPHERFKDYIREIGSSISITLTNNNVNDIKPYDYSISILESLMEATKNKSRKNKPLKETPKNNNKFPFHKCIHSCIKEYLSRNDKTTNNNRKRIVLSEAHSALAKYYREIGIKLIVEVKDAESQKITAKLITNTEEFFYGSQNLLSDIFFQFGVAGLKKQRYRVFVEFLDQLRKHCRKEASPTCHAYWGLLARIAATNESAKAWVKNTELDSAEYTSEEIDAARDYFIFEYSDFETADALQQLKEYLFPTIYVPPITPAS